MSDKPRKHRLGELLVQQNLVSQETVDTALRVQVGGNRRLGYILVRMKAITTDQLAETLAQQLDTPIIIIADKFSPEVKKAVPRYLCRQYGILPLAFKQNNILEVAMSDPSDGDAISDLEHYTGKVIEPFLARHSDIDREIGRRVQLSMKDFFTPQTNIWATRTVAVLALILVFGLGFFTYDYIQQNRYGTVSTTDTHVLYKNHDLILGVDNIGKISLLGHGAFAKGYYSVSFDNPDTLNAFAKSREKDFSEKQRNWLKWAIGQASSNSLTRDINKS
jgi:hypothetical protein